MLTTINDLGPVSTILVTCTPIAFLLVGAALLYIHFFYVDFPRIKSLPEIPNADFLAGHLYQLKQDHAETLHGWSLKYGWPIFQARMGYRRAIFLNGFDAAQEWISKNHAATADRPWFHTFHGVVSATSAATIGSSPWNDRTKKQRRVFGSYTTAPSIKRMRPVMDLESYDVLNEIYQDSKHGAGEISPHMYMKRIALNSQMMFGYGTRFSSSKDPLFHQIVSDATIIASFRSSNSNYQDFIPHLRYLAKNDRLSAALAVRTRRDKWLKTMFDSVSETVGIQQLPHKTVVELMLTDHENGLTDFDYKTILGGLISGGFETLFTSAVMGIGVLASPIGQDIQQKAYDDLVSHYETPEEAFQFAVDEDKSTYIAAFVKEVLRFYPPLKMLPPRQTLKEFDYHGALIPKGVLVYLNSQAINRDTAAYGADADKFRPERWLVMSEKDSSKSSSDESTSPSPSPPAPPPSTLYTFGAGARVCTGVNFATRVLYGIFARTIVSFQLKESKVMPVNTHYLDYNADPTAANTCPRDFKVRFIPRDEARLQRCFEKSRVCSASVVPSPVPISQEGSA